MGDINTPQMDANYLTTVEPLGTDTSILRTFPTSQQNSPKLSFNKNLYNTDTSLRQTLPSVPSVSVLERFDCNGFDSKKSISGNLTYFLRSKATEFEIILQKKFKNVNYNS